jgi:hypothetical protein
MAIVQESKTEMAGISPHDLDASSPTSPLEGTERDLDIPSPITAPAEDALTLPALRFVRMKKDASGTAIATLGTNMPSFYYARLHVDLSGLREVGSGLHFDLLPGP